MGQFANLVTWGMLLTVTALLDTVRAAGCSTKHPVLQPGETYVPAEGCQGVTFTNGQRCHCWSHCGWICVDVATTTTMKSPGKQCPANVPVPSGSKWVPDPGCNNGPTYDQGGYHCHCYDHCGYICDPKSNPGPPPNPPPNTTAKPAGGCPYGSPWIPPHNPSLICICKGFDKTKYYECSPATTTPTTTPTTVTTPTTPTTTTPAPG